MKKLVIFQEKELNGKKERVTLRTITPSFAFQGYARNSSILKDEWAKLARSLEPTMTGFFIS